MTFLQIETIIIELLLIVSLVAIAVRRFYIPYTVALVLVGLLIAIRSPFEIQAELTPELILALFVPPLVFEAAFHINLTTLRQNLTGILMLAVPGVIITTLIVGGLVSMGTFLSLPVALVFGSLIAATDPVAVVALFKSMGVPKRLSVLLEGESLLNDGTAIVTFGLVLTMALTGSFSLVEGVADFILVALGGTLVGLFLGWIISELISRVDDYLIETTLTTILAFGSYLIAERLHVSGVLAVVAAGLVNGNISPHGMSPTTRIVLFNFWEYVAFLVSSLVFLLIGLEVNLPALASAWQPVFWGIVSVLIARFIVVYGMSWLINRWTEPIPHRWQHMLAWGGLRGAISLALALSLPAAMGNAERDLIRLMTFGVVLFTLLIQGTTMRSVIRRLHIIYRSETQIEYEKQHARLTALRAAETRLDRMHDEGGLSTPAWERLKPDLRDRIHTQANGLRNLLHETPMLETEELDNAKRELLHAERSALLNLRRDGVISEEVFEQLTSEVDYWLSDDVLVNDNSNPL